MGGRATGLGLSWCHPEPQGWAWWQGRTAVSSMGSAAAGAVGCSQAPELPPCLVPEPFRLPWMFLTLAGPWAHHELLLVPRSSTGCSVESWDSWLALTLFCCY